MSNLPPLRIDDAKIIFVNFQGLEGKYNAAGTRNFSVVLEDHEVARQMEKDGWNVKWPKREREDGEPFDPHLPVAVSFKFYPPRCVLMSHEGRNILDEETCGLIDLVEREFVDVLINPSRWDVNGNHGVKAYLKTIYVKLRDDPLDMKYSDVPIIGSAPATPTPELPAGNTNIIEGTGVWSE